MKMNIKHHFAALAMLISGAVMLTLSPQADAQQRFKDPLYGKKDTREQKEYREAVSKADSLKERTRNLNIFILDEPSAPSLPEKISFDPESWASENINVNVYYSRFYNPWYYGGWYGYRDPWYYGAYAWNDPWYYGAYAWNDPWYWNSWYGGWYDPWYYPGWYSPWYYSAWYGYGNPYWYGYAYCCDPWYHHHCHGGSVIVSGGSSSRIYAPLSGGVSPSTNVSRSVASASRQAVSRNGSSGAVRQSSRSNLMTSGSRRSDSSVRSSTALAKPAI